MAKNSYSLLTLLKTLYTSKEITKPFDYPTLLIYNALFIFLVAILSGFKAIIDGDSFIFNVTSVFVALPSLIIILFSIIYLFISAFQSHKKSFIHATLVFSSYIIPLIAIGHTINLFESAIYSTSILSIFNSILLAILGYAIILSIKNSKAYFQIRYSTSIASIVLTSTVFLTLSLIYYIILLIQNIQGSIQ